MKAYILTRIAAIIPILFLASILSFVLSKNVPQDPVEQYLINIGGVSLNEDYISSESIEYKKAAQELGLDKPSFYCSILPFYINKDAKNRHWVPIPYFTWNGFDNQYHNWLKKALVFDFGSSFVDGRAVSTKLIKAFKWTGFFMILCLISIFSVGIPLGIYLVNIKHSKLKRTIETGLYLIYAIPVFWLASLMVVFFTTDDYGTWTNIFPSIGLTSIENGLWDMVKVLTLPTFIIAIHSAAYISRQTKVGLLNEHQLQYTKTALAKGLDIKSVLYKHNLKNALIPLITIGTELVPSLFSGTLILEVIFNIPGIGRLLYNSIDLADWNVVFALLLIIAIATSISYLIGDLLYKFANPRIKLS